MDLFGSRVIFALGNWFLLAVVVGASGLLLHWPPPFPQLLLGSLVLAQIALAAAWPRLRAWLRAVPADPIVALHVSRLPIGAYFLWLHARGRLPWAFAVPGGWGDIAVGAGALALVALRRLGRPAPGGAYALWNALGLVDILVVVATAARLAQADPDSMRRLLLLPLALLPTFVVPLIVFTHLVLLVRGREP